jgi:hypothetical protein
MKWILTLACLFLASQADAQILRHGARASGTCSAATVQATVAGTTQATVTATATGTTRVRVSIRRGCGPVRRLLRRC